MILKRVLHPSLYPRGWRRFEKYTIAAHRYCSFCDSMKKLQVHHILPLHAGGPALDPTNVIVLCAQCHLYEAHLGNFHDWDEDIVAASVANLRRIQSRRLIQTVSQP